MTEQQLQSWRRERLAALIREKFNGLNVELARALRHSNGSYVGQMLAGRRPISEKIVMEIEALRGLSGWFQQPVQRFASDAPSPIYSTKERSEWPFANHLLERIQRLDRRWLGHLEIALSKAIDECEALETNQDKAA